MSLFSPSHHTNQFLLNGNERIYLEDLSEEAKAQMVNIQAADDEIMHLRRRLAIFQTARRNIERELATTLRQDGLL